MISRKKSKKNWKLRDPNYDWDRESWEYYKPYIVRIVEDIDYEELETRSDNNIKVDVLYRIRTQRPLPDLKLGKDILRIRKQVKSLYGDTRNRVLSSFIVGEE